MGVIECGAHASAEVLEAADDTDRGSDVLGLSGQGNQAAMLGRGRVIGGDRHVEDVFVDVAGTELASRLERCEALGEGVAVEDGSQILGFILAGNGSPVQLVLNQGSWFVHARGGDPVAGGCVYDSAGWRWELAGELVAVVQLLSE